MKLTVGILLKIFLILIPIFSQAASKNNSAPSVKYPNRYIRFQAGAMGHKPWDHFVSYSPKANFNAAVFNKLITVTSDYQLKPGILLSWKWNYGLKYYEFKINKELKFSKNRMISPTDIEFAIVKHFISKVSETDKRLFYDIKGVEKLRAGAQFKTGMCEGVEIVDDETFRIYLKTANPNFLYSLGDIVSPIAPVEDFKDDYFTFKGLPRGTGAYRVVWSDKKSSLVRLERKNLEHYRKQDSSPLEIDFYNHGTTKENKIDIATGADAKALDGDPSFTVIKGPIPIGITILDFNYKSDLGKNKKFRKAVALAINRSELAALSPFRTEHHELIPEKYFGRTGLKYEYNVRKARDIVNKNFKNASSPKKPLLGIYHGDGSEPKSKTAEIIENQLRRVGIYMLFKPDDGVYFKGKFEKAVMSTYGSVSSFVDPLTSFANYLPGTSSPENTDLNDQVSVNLFKELKITESKEKKDKLLRKLSKHFHSEVRTLPLAQIYQAYAYNRKVKNLNLEKSIMVVDFTKVQMNPKASRK